MVIKIERKDVAEFNEREVLFTLPAEVEGDPDVEYTIPKKVAPGRSLWFLDQINNKGEMVGSLLVLKEMLGTEGYDALLNSPYVDNETLGAIAKACVDKIMGIVDDTSGK